MKILMHWPLPLTLGSLLFAAALQAQSPYDLNRIQVGQPAPDFTAINSEGKPVELSSFRGKNLILVFYRGQW